MCIEAEKKVMQCNFFFGGGAKQIFVTSGFSDIYQTPYIKIYRLYAIPTRYHLAPLHGIIAGMYT